MAFHKGLFSERYKLVKPTEVFIREKLTEEITNAIENCYIAMWDYFDNEPRIKSSPIELSREKIERKLWTGYLCKSASDFKPNGHNYVLTSSYIIKSNNYQWFEILDLIEYTIKFIKLWIDVYKSHYTSIILQNFIVKLNYEFERLDFAYRIIGNEIIEISDDNEIASIEQANNISVQNVKEHLQKAMRHISQKPSTDASNSIKESISALEAVCRDLTGEATLGKSLKKLESKGISIHPRLIEGFEKLYIYTNQPDTGIRHALMDASNLYTPSKDEAHLMLVLCCAFINYVHAKSAPSSNIL